MRKRTKVTLGIVTILMLMGGGVAVLNAVAEYRLRPVPAAIQPPAKQLAMDEAVNKERKARGLNVLPRNTLLDASAQVRADEIAESNKFSHTRPDGNEFGSMLASQFPGGMAGENLAMCTADVNDTVARWIASPAHNEIMFRSNWEYMGIGQTYDEDKHCTIYVMHFARD